MVSPVRAAGGARRLSAPVAGAALLLAFALIGCNRSRDDVREWRPSDHDRAEEQQDTAQGAEQQQPEAPEGGPPAMPSLRELGITDVTLATWKQNCTVCHGLIGRGDGPQGSVLRPPDLTNPEWQKKASDDEIRATIKKGRGRMPAFAFPDDTVDGLLKLVRLLNSERPAEPEPSAQPQSAAPAPQGSAAQPAPQAPAHPVPTSAATGNAPPASAPVAPHP